LAWDWERHGLVVANANINYRVPITYKGELYGFLQCTNVGNKSLTFNGLLAQPDGEGWLTLAEATFVLVGFDFATMTSMAIPERYKAQLQATINH
jgi:acyl-CoA thioesterase FadM